MFAYHITLHNDNTETIVQLRNRHWVIMDGRGKTEEVRCVLRGWVGRGWVGTCGKPELQFRLSSKRHEGAVGSRQHCGAARCCVHTLTYSGPGADRERRGGHVQA